MGRPAPQPVADESAKNIINAINAIAESQMAQTKLKQSLMLDQISRQRNLADNKAKLGQERENKILEQKDNMSAWGDMFDSAPSGQQASGVATSQTANTVGTNPNSPISPVSPVAPQGGYSADQPAPMSMAPQFSQPEAAGAQPVGQGDGQVVTIRGSSGKYMNIPLNGMAPEQAIQQAKSTGVNLGIFNSQEEAQAAIGGQGGSSGQPSPDAAPMAPAGQMAAQPAPVSDQFQNLGFTPIGIGQLAMARKGQPEAKDFSYIKALNKIKAGNASSGEIQLVKDFNGYKGETSSLEGIDTVNLSPEQIGEELKMKNPGHYNFLESVKDGKYKITGRSSKEMNKVVEQIQTIWPGTDLQALQARYDVRKDFTSGKTANNITALNTALSHLDKLSRNADVLDNGAFRFGNKLGNVLKTQTGDSRVRVLNSDIHAVTGELANTFKQSGATDQEIHNFQSALDAADSKEVIKNVVDEFIGLIGGRTQPLLERYQNAFGPDASFPVVGRSGQAVLQKHGFEWNPQTGDILKAGDQQQGGQNNGVPDYDPATQKLQQNKKTLEYRVVPK